MNELEQLRCEIDRLDKQLAQNLNMRLNLVKLIGIYKRKNNINITDTKREQEIIKNFVSLAGPNTETVIQAIIKCSKDTQ